MLFITTMRYQIDYAPTILLGSLVACLSLESSIRNGFQKRVFSVAAIGLILFGVVAHMAFGMIGLRDTLRRGNPESFFALEDFFRPVSSVLEVFSKSGQVRILDFTTPEGMARFEDGSEGPWVGPRGVYLRLYSPQSLEISLSGNFFVTPEEPVVLEFQTPKGKETETLQSGVTHRDFSVMLAPGVNRIGLFANSAAGSNKTGKNLKLAVFRDMKIAPSNGSNGRPSPF